MTVRRYSESDMRRELAARRARRRARSGGFLFPIWSTVNGGFDPATLALELWERPDYSGSPWAGTASAGGSGSQSLSDGAAAPAVGSNVIGTYDMPDFNGSSHKLAGAACSTFLTTTNFSLWILCYVRTITALAVTHTSNNPDYILCTTGTGQWGINFVNDSGTTVGMRMFAGGVDKAVSTSISTGAWSLIQAKANGTNQYIRVNGGTRQSAAGGTIGSLSAALDVGRNINQNNWFDGYVAEIALSKSFWSDDEEDDIREGYIVPRYGVG